MKKLLFLFYILQGLSVFSQLPYTEDFESGSGGFTTDIGQSTDNGTDYFILTDGSNINATFSGTTGSFFAAQDIDAAPTPGSGGNATLTISGIDITGCSGLSLSIDLAEDDDGSNNDWDDTDFLHITGSIDGGAAQNIIWIEGAGGFNTAPFIDTDFDGDGDGTEITSAFQTFTNAISGTGSTLTITISMHLDSGDEDIAFDNISISGTGCSSCTGPVTEPTNEATALTSSNIACTTADLSWTLGADATNSLVVISTSAITGAPVDGTHYTANAVYGSGDILNAGEYIIYNGTGNSVSISGLTAGTNYFITIFEYNGAVNNCEENYLTGGTSTSFTTNTGCVSTDPLIQSILYNACGSSEGTDEIVYFTTGTDPLSIDDITINYPNQTYCNTCSGVSGTVDGGNLNNSTYVNDLNTTAGCTIFAYADPIPANSDVMIFTGNPPSTVLDYSSQCGSSNLPVYVIFNDNSSTTGRFANSATRDLTIDFGNGTSETVTYDGSQQSGDGATANYDANGNVSYATSTDCVYPLPIKLGQFYLNQSDQNITIYWTTLSETNCDYFEVQKSMDGINFTTIGKVIGSGNTTHEIRYRFTDYELTDGTVYYRLKQFDFDGKYDFSFTITTNNSSNSIFYSTENIYFNLNDAKPNQSYRVNIYNLSGQLINTTFTNGNNTIHWSEKGLFIIEIPELDIRQKITSF